MAHDQFHKGLATIHAALETALGERGVTGAAVEHDGQDGDPKDTQFSVSVGGKSETQTFARQEIEDSALAIDAPSAVKVRLLVGPFVR